MRRLLLVLAIFVAVAAPTLPVIAQSQSGSPSVSQSSSAPSLVFTPAPKAQPSTLTFSASGNAQAAQMTQLNQQIAALTATLNTQTAQLAANQQTILTLQNQKAAVQGQLTSAQQALTTMQAQLDAANTALSGGSAAQVEVAGLNLQISQLTAQLAIANSNLTAAQAAAAQTQANLQTQITAGQAALAAAQASNTSLVSDKAALQAQVSSLTTQLATANAALAAGGIVRQVWAHSIPSNCPFTDSYGNYASLMPLAIYKSTDLQYSLIPLAGLDGIAVDGYTAPLTWMPERLSQGDAKGFLVSYCIDTAGEAASRTAAQVTSDVETAISQYWGITSGHTSVQKIAGNPTVWTYNDPAHMGPSDWLNVHNARPYTSIFGDVGGSYINTDSQSTAAGKLATYSQAFAAEYSFGPTTSATLLAGFAASGKPAAWTVRPGYTRIPGSYVDAQGTGVFVAAFQDAFLKSLVTLPGQINTVFIPTWDDIVEETNICPDTYWNWTRTDLCAVESALYKRQPLPFASSRVYLTQPQAAYLGQTVRFEAVVANMTAHSDQLTVTLRNLNGVAIGSGFGGLAAPYSVTTFARTLTITPDILAQCQVSGLSTLKINETLTDAVTGGSICSHEGARTALYTTAAPSGYGHTEYYSVPSNRALSPVPTGSVNVSPAGVITASINYPAGAHIVQLLHDTRRVHAWFDPTSPISGTVLAADNRGADYRGDSGDHGVWEIEVVMGDNNNWKVGWSDPLTVTHK